jgi:cobalt/nickel transport system permease protein
MTSILDDYALMSPLRGRNNWLKLTIVAFGLLVGVSSSSPIVPMFIIICMSFATLFFGKIPLSFYLKLLIAPLGFAVVGVLIIAFSSGSGVALYSFKLLGYPLVVRKDGLELAILVLFRSISGMSCLYFLALSTPILELFSVLKATRLPDSIIELSMLIYRYIFVFLDMALCIKFAQTVRLGYGDFKKSCRSLGMLTSTLFIRAWEQGEKLFISMNSRCYDGKLTLLEAKKPIKAPEILLTSLYFLSTLTLFYLTKGISFL